jgi:hypothetical protein
VYGIGRLNLLTQLNLRNLKGLISLRQITSLHIVVQFQVRKIVMIDELKTITIKAYRTPSGSPTCSSDYQKGRTCQWLGGTNCGMTPVCMVTRNILDRESELGYLAPDSNCPIWSKE